MSMNNPLRLGAIALLVVARSLFAGSITYYEGRMSAVNETDKKTVPVVFLYERRVLPEQNRVIEISHAIVDGTKHHQTFTYDHASHQISVQDEKGKRTGNGTFHCSGDDRHLERLTSCTYHIEDADGLIVGTDSYDGNKSITYDSVVDIRSQKLKLRTQGSGARVDGKTFRTRYHELFGN